MVDARLQARVLVIPALGLLLGGCARYAAADSGSGAAKSGGPAAPTQFQQPTLPPGSATAPSGGESEVWSHSPDTLYRLDASTKTLTQIARFSGCDGDVTDIALDAGGRLLATTADALWSVDKGTGVCTHIASGSFPNSLSFVPAGTLDAEKEVLVGYNEGSYVRIDSTTGQTTVIGQLGGDLASSGDIVSVAGGSTYLTVTGTGCDVDDCLVEVDPKTGAMVKNWGSTGHSSVYGLAFWAGSVYGFDAGGELFEISFAGGQLTTTAIPVPLAGASGGAVSFWGAGSTTSAPLTSVR